MVVNIAANILLVLSILQVYVESATDSQTPKMTVKTSGTPTSKIDRTPASTPGGPRAQEDKIVATTKFLIRLLLHKPIYEEGVKNVTLSVLMGINGTARGRGWQKIGAYVNLGAYYLVGILLAILLAAFVLHVGGKSLAVGHSEVEGISRFTTVVPGTNESFSKLVQQL